MLEFVSDRGIYEKAIAGAVPQAERQLWIATADIKDMYVDSGSIFRKEMVPFLKILDGLLKRGVEIRLIHAKEPGPAFRKDFDKFPGLFQGLERVLCPRVHFKCVIVDRKLAYFGSANLTGAGMGAKGETRRNFENGVMTDEKRLLEPLLAQYDDVWRGKHCRKCGRRQYCPDCPVS